MREPKVRQYTTNTNDEFTYSFRCGCKSVQKYVETGSYVQYGEKKPIIEERWFFHSCGDVRHVSVDSVLDDKNWPLRQDLIKRLSNKKK